MIEFSMALFKVNQDIGDGIKLSEDSLANLVSEFHNAKETKKIFTSNGIEVGELKNLSFQGDTVIGTVSITEGFKQIRTETGLSLILKKLIAE